MAKAKTSKKQKKSLLNTLTKHETNTQLLKDKKLILDVLIDSILQNDLDTFRDVLVAHLRTMSKTELARKTGLGRQTLYDLIEGQSFDPRLSTLSAILNKISA